MKKKVNIFCYLVLSIIAAVQLLVLTLITSPNNISIYDKIFIGIIFIGSCIFGISMAMNPGWFRRLIKYENQNEKNNKSKKPKMKYSGHHPDCEKFQSHKIKIRNKTFCAGCLGLAIGSLMSIIIISIYVFIKIQSSILFNFLIIIGLIIIIINYIEIFFPTRIAIVHVALNILLVTSFIIITISIFQITGNKFFAIVGVIFSFLWLDTRIQFSHWQHSRICMDCKKSCKIY